MRCRILRREAPEGSITYSSSGVTLKGGLDEGGDCVSGCEGRGGEGGRAGVGRDQ